MSQGLSSSKFEALEIITLHSLGVTQGEEFAEEFDDLRMPDGFGQNHLLHDLLLQFFLGGYLVRRLTCEHLVKNDPYSVEIGFIAIEVAFKGLWGHIERCAHVHAVFKSKT